VKHNPDSRQGSLWSEPEPIVLAGVLPEMWQADPVELRKLIEVRKGVAKILASKFAEWSRYTRSKSFRDHVENMKPELEKLFGPLEEVAPMVPIGSRAWREVRDYWLTHLQLNHALIFTRLPQLRNLRGLVTTVFTEFQSGGLVSTNVETTIRIQDATVAAEEAAPGVTQIGAELARREDAIAARIAAEQARDEVIIARKAIDRLEGKGRRDPNADAVRCGKYIVWHIYRGLCPCCQTIEIMDSKDHLIVGVKNWDHASGNHHKNGPLDGWYVCAECNKRFEDKDEAFRQEVRPAWDTYIRHVRYYFKLTTKLI
jgi:hypothetical protein